MWFLLLAIILIALFYVNGKIRSWTRNRREEKRGWRVGHYGRDQMYYEELRDGHWARINLDGEMLSGPAHHVLYLSSTRFPEWATERRVEIIDRIKIEFRNPDYEYH